MLGVQLSSLLRSRNGNPTFRVGLPTKVNPITKPLTCPQANLVKTIRY